MSSGAITRIHDCSSPLPSSPMPSAMSSTGHSVMNVHHTVHETMPERVAEEHHADDDGAEPVHDPLGTPLVAVARREHLDHADEHHDQRPQVPPRESRHDLAGQEDEPDRDQEDAEPDAAVALGVRTGGCGGAGGYRGHGWRRRCRRSAPTGCRCRWAALLRSCGVVLVTHSRSLPQSPACTVRLAPNGSSG